MRAAIGSLAGGGPDGGLCCQPGSPRRMAGRIAESRMAGQRAGRPARSLTRSRRWREAAPDASGCNAVVQPVPAGSSFLVLLRWPSGTPPLP